MKGGNVVLSSNVGGVCRNVSEGGNVVLSSNVGGVCRNVNQRGKWSAK